MGAWPGRDFVEPGMPLMVLLSAAAQWVAPGFLSEALLCITLLAVASGLVCLVTTELTASTIAGVVAGVATVAWFPRLYSYPKLLVPAVTLWLFLRYVRSRSAGALWALAAWSVASFLLRHDLGVMAALATLAGIAALHDVPMAARRAAGARFVGAGVLLVAPYLLYLQAVEGIGEHVRVATEFSKAEQHQLLWTASLAPDADGLTVPIGPWQVSPEAVLFWLYYLLLAVGAYIAAVTTNATRRAGLTAWVVLAVLFNLVILRHPLSARLPDVAVAVDVGAVAMGYALVVRLLALRRRRPVAAVAGLVGAALIALVTVQSAWAVVNLGDRLAQAGVPRGVGGILRSARSVVQAWDGRSWAPYWPQGEEPPVLDYLRRCLTPGDRVLVTWFAPEYFVFSGRGFAAGHALFYPASFATERDQAQMLDRLSRDSVPAVLINTREHEAFVRAFPRLAEHIRTHYTVRGSFLHNRGTPIDVAVRNDIDVDHRFDAPPWTCATGADRRILGLLGHNLSPR
jgi:hypothetical protein